jgi:hypothetical protein
MAGEPISSEAPAGWSRRNVADVAIALIGFGVIVCSTDGLMAVVTWVLMALLPGFEQNYDKAVRLAMCGGAFLELFLGLWLLAHHRKISTRLFCAGPGAPLAERRAALGFGIKVYALYLAVSFAFGGAASWEIRKAVMFASQSDHRMLWYMPLSLAPYLAEIAICLYFLKRPGWLVAFAYPDGEPDEDA